MLGTLQSLWWSQGDGLYAQVPLPLYWKLAANACFLPTLQVHHAREVNSMSEYRIAMRAFWTEYDILNEQWTILGSCKSTILIYSSGMYLVLLICKVNLHFVPWIYIRLYSTQPSSWGLSSSWNELHELNINCYNYMHHQYVYIPCVYTYIGLLYIIGVCTRTVIRTPILNSINPYSCSSVINIDLILSPTALSLFLSLLIVQDVVLQY